MEYENFQETLLDILDIQDRVIAIDLKTQQLIESILKELEE